jgi:hypothetical protein
LALATAVVCLGVGLSGVATARQADPARHSQYRLRFGKLGDKDRTGGDGLFGIARGHASCKRGERLISGGLRLQHAQSAAITGHFELLESAPQPGKRRWSVAASSDLGGEARSDFVVVAYCRSR